MYWLRSLLFYKTFLLFSFFTTFVSSCSPKVNNWDVFSISQSNTKIRLQPYYGDAKPNNDIYTFKDPDNHEKPYYYEIFLLTQLDPTLSFYEFRLFEDFYRTLVIEMNVANSSRPFILLDYNANSDNQRFSIDCGKCDIKPNSTDWTQYHTSCSITNKASNLCMNSVGDNNNLMQSDFNNLFNGNLNRRTSIDFAYSSSTGSAFSSPIDSAGLSCSTPMIKTDPNNVQISKGGLVATVLGSIIGTGLITLATSYWFIQRKRIYPGHALNT
ncbi:unnamed protein product [Rhizophagus irregularis]|nr:unnamed protein product [Rhizophagus irregularis]